MPYDSMAAWDRNTFEFNDTIQQRGGCWSGTYSFDSDVGRTISRDDYTPPSPPALSDEAPSFTDATRTWSPPSSPRSRAQSLRASPERMSPIGSPRIDSAPYLDDSSPTTTDSGSQVQMSRKDRQALADKLYIASCAGDLRHMLLLLSLGAPINMPSLVHNLYDAFKPAKSGNLSALAGAAGNRQLGAVKLLLERGAVLNPDMKQSSSSPLHQACKADDVEITEYLLEQGADVDALNCYRTTPLMYAVKHGSHELVALVLAYNPDLHILSFINTAAVHWGVWPGNEDVMQLLLEAGADPNHAMGDGSTPLHCAASSGLGSICEMLVRYGADPRKRNEAWKTPGMVAVEQGHPNLGEWLKEAEKRTVVEVRSR